MNEFYIHYTGYVICSSPLSSEYSLPTFFYTLSTESSFCFEMLDSFWANITEPFAHNSVERPFSVALMGGRGYYTRVSNLPYPVEVKYPKNNTSFILKYYKILYSRK